MDKLPPGLPIIYSSFNFDGDRPAERYVLPAKHPLLAPGQITVPVTEKGYDDVLNAEGQELLAKTRSQLNAAKAVLRGQLKSSRTGTVFHDDGCVELCSWYNAVYVGKVVASETMEIGKEIQTSVLVLYEIDENGEGWMLTKSGSIYKTIH